MTRSGISEVPLPAVPTDSLVTEDGTSLPARATAGDDHSETSSPLLQDPFSVNSKCDEEITSGDDSNTTPPTPCFMNHGCGAISVAIIVLITIVLCPSLWLKIGA
jgi:acyl-CoA synthetase (AMP-forming)/AMP-acid ligase II